MVSPCKIQRLHAFLISSRIPYEQLKRETFASRNADNLIEKTA